MAKNRFQTEKRLLCAVEDILLNDGFPGIGINAIARQAACDKVLIYRYFGDLDGLLMAFSKTRDLWWQPDDIITETHTQITQIALLEYLQILLKRHLDVLQTKPLTLEIMAWELSATNNLTVALAEIRAERGMALVKKIREHYQNPPLDIGGILGVFGAAINYLVMRTRHSSPQSRIEEWWRLQQTISTLLDACH